MQEFKLQKIYMRRYLQFQPLTSTRWHFAKRLFITIFNPRKLLSESKFLEMRPLVVLKLN